MSKESKFVCTPGEARKYFDAKGLTYNDVKEGDIAVLLIFLKQEIEKSIEFGECIRTMHTSKRVDLKKKPDGSIKRCMLYVNGDYFEQRECISFYEDGMIGFAGWADIGNLNPILRAFLRWCDALKGASYAETWGNG